MCGDSDFLCRRTVFAGAVLTLPVGAFSSAAVLDKPF